MTLYLSSSRETDPAFTAQQQRPGLMNPRREEVYAEGAITVTHSSITNSVGRVASDRLYAHHTSEWK